MSTDRERKTTTQQEQSCLRASRCFLWHWLDLSLNRDVPLTPYFHLTDGNLTKDAYNVLRRL